MYSTTTTIGITPLYLSLYQYACGRLILIFITMSTWTLTYFAHFFDILWRHYRLWLMNLHLWVISYDLFYVTHVSKKDDSKCANDSKGVKIIFINLWLLSKIFKNSKCQNSSFKHKPLIKTKIIIIFFHFFQPEISLRQINFPKSLYESYYETYYMK